MAMKPRVEGTLAAVDAPSRTRVNARSGRLPRMTGMAMTTDPGSRISAVMAVRITAAKPKSGPICITR